MPHYAINKQRGTPTTTHSDDFDSSANVAVAAAAGGDGTTIAVPKLSHRLFSHNKQKRKASSRDAAVVMEQPSSSRPRKKRAPPPPVEERPGISILEGITRGSIANMVLARLGKLNPNELIGAAPSKPVLADQFQDDDNDMEEDGEESTDHRADGEPKEDEEPNHEGPSGERMVQEQEEDAISVPVKKEQITFLDGVKPQPPSEDNPNQELEGIYLVKSGPYIGSRGILYRIAEPDYFILQTDDGGVATVHQSQITKVHSYLPPSHSYSRVKLTNEDKKNFVDDVKFYLTGGEGYIRREEIATRGMEAANALKIAMTTLDPRRDVFRFRRSSKATPNNNSNSATSEAARQPQR